jgi:hypothetical protein
LQQQQNGQQFSMPRLQSQPQVEQQPTSLPQLEGALQDASLLQDGELQELLQPQLELVEESAFFSSVAGALSAGASSFLVSAASKYEAIVLRDVSACGAVGAASCG